MPVNLLPSSCCWCHSPAVCIPQPLRRRAGTAGRKATQAQLPLCLTEALPLSRRPLAERDALSKRDPGSAWCVDTCLALHPASRRGGPAGTQVWRYTPLASFFRGQTASPLSSQCSGRTERQIPLQACFGQGCSFPSQMVLGRSTYSP